MKQVTTRSFTFAAITTFFFVSVREKTRDETVGNVLKSFVHTLVKVVVSRLTIV